MNAIDDIDKKILNILQDNGRMTNAELAKRIGLSPPSVLERLKKIEKAGIIKRYTAVIEPKKIDKNIITLTAISLTPHQERKFKKFNEAIQSWPEVLECYHVTGNEDYIIKVAVKDIEAYEEFIYRKLSKIPGIKNIRTTMVLSTVKYNNKILVE